MDFSKHTDKQLKNDAFRILAHAIIPMENWFCVFSNTEPDLMNRPGLRCKAFYIWFPTMIDVLVEEDKIIKDLYDEITKRDIIIKEVQELTFILIDLFKKVLSNFSREEQLFLNNRRLQNAHGFLSMYFRNITTKWFDGKTNQIVADQFEPKDYEATLLYLNQDMQNQSISLLNKFVAHNDGYNLMKFYAENLGSLKIEQLIKNQ